MGGQNFFPQNKIHFCPQHFFHTISDDFVRHTISTEYQTFLSVTLLFSSEYGHYTRPAAAKGEHKHFVQTKNKCNRGWRGGEKEFSTEYQTVSVCHTFVTLFPQNIRQNPDFHYHIDQVHTQNIQQGRGLIFIKLFTMCPIQQKLTVTNDHYETHLQKPPHPAATLQGHTQTPGPIWVLKSRCSNTK